MCTLIYENDDSPGLFESYGTSGGQSIRRHQDLIEKGMIIPYTYHWYKSYIILLRTASPGCQWWAYESYGTRGGQSTGRHQRFRHTVTGICIYGMRLYGCTYCWTCFTWYMTFWALASWHSLTDSYAWTPRATRRVMHWLAQAPWLDTGCLEWH